MACCRNAPPGEELCVTRLKTAAGDTGRFVVHRLRIAFSPDKIPPRATKAVQHTQPTNS